jgi:hypothetical protein
MTLYQKWCYEKDKESLFIVDQKAKTATVYNQNFQNINTK